MPITGSPKCVSQRRVTCDLACRNRCVLCDGLGPKQRTTCILLVASKPHRYHGLVLALRVLGRRVSGGQRMISMLTLLRGDMVGGVLRIQRVGLSIVWELREGRQ